MIQCGGGAGFLLEAEQSFGIKRDQLRKNFNGNFAIETGVAGAIDLAHASGTEGRENLILTEHCAGGEGHCSGDYSLRRGGWSSGGRLCGGSDCLASRTDRVELRSTGQPGAAVHT